MPQRFAFSVEARADLRAIDRETALRLLKTFARYLATDTGDVRQLEGFNFNPPQHRLRVGDWRFIFRKSSDGAIEVARVRNRSEAYR